MKKRSKKNRKPRHVKRVKRIKRVKRAKRIKRVKRTKKIKRTKRIRRSKKSNNPKTFVGKGILEQLFESQAKVKLMKFFLRNCEESFQLKDIFKKIRTNVFALRQEIKKLEKIDLIKQKRAMIVIPKKRGGVRKFKKTVYYLNPNFDFLNELKDLILKSTVSSKEELIGDVRKLGNIKLLVLAGIFKGDDSSEADILIVGDKINQRKFSTFLKDLEAEVGKELKCATMTSKEFNYRYDMYDRFVRDLISTNSEVLLNKMKLW